MRKNLESAFNARQYMVSHDFEIYYYNDLKHPEVSLHSHDYYEFYFFLEGDVSIQIGKEVHSIKPGDILLMPPKISHRPIFHSENVPYRRFVFWISQDYCKHLAELSSDYVYLIDYVRKNKKYIFHNDPISFNTVHSKIVRLLEEIHSQRFGRDTQVTLCVNDLIFYLNRLAYEQNEPARITGELDLYQKLLEYIEDHLDEDLSLESIASEFYVSKYHIAHIFKDRLGMSIHQYITKKRLSLSKEAILGAASITEVYQSFGFSDYSSFFRAFKKEFGMSPKEYKDMQSMKF